MKTYPDALIDSHWEHEKCKEGLSKREYFAALALGGLLASDRPSSEAARYAVKSADMLIEYLNKEAKENE